MDKLIREQGVQLSVSMMMYMSFGEASEEVLMKLDNTAILLTEYIKVLPKHGQMWGAG
ncbi:MAG: hypothetical protein CM1200mP30_06050 [Pseudomonadota bacterium]|nr:MAG: hypothetical protein CM1200mP30_06050 [Pseudomonadota bacterium]